MERKIRERPPLFRALGAQSPPQSIEIDGTEYVLQDVFKHDSWAATALYRGGDQDVVCKFNRTESILGIPCGWLGRLLADREAFAMRCMKEVPGVPDNLGPVHAEGKLFRSAVAHPFIPGHPLGADEQVDDNFFPELLGHLREVHNRKMAYVDLHKRENILVGDDGKPYLIDFQICYRSAAMRKFSLPTTRIILKLLQNSDLYHFTKHVKRLRPDQIEHLGLTQYVKRPWWIRAHRTVAVPFRTFRRKFLTWIGVRGKSGRSATETFAEHAFRCENNQQNNQHNKAA